jgi:hypothetical protein
MTKKMMTEMIQKKDHSLIMEIPTATARRNNDFVLGKGY